eukprot:jgi/Tetstr1/423628/TSEL_001400.t1
MAGELSTMAVRRIQHELNDWLTSEGSDGILLEECEPMNVWTIIMKGPDGGTRLYEEEVFRLRVTFAPNYPMEPPEVIFLPEVPVHPHIYSNGHICLDILYDGRDGGWSPALTISKLCLSLHSMLASNTEKCKPPGDQEYVNRMRGKSPKLTRWAFHDDQC